MADRRRGAGWVPKQHGAWALLLAPLLLGFLLSGRLDWRQVVLMAFVLVGYLAFYATGLWLKSRRKARYLPPVQAYVAAAAVLGVILLVSAGHLLAWAPLFAVPIAVGLYASATRDERSIWSGLATTAGATLLTPVAFDVAGDWCGRTDEVWFVTVALGMYLAGTVFYVKTMIRERESKGWWLASVLWHVLGLLVVALGPLLVDHAGWGSPFELAIGVYLVLLVRAVVLPRYRLTPRTVGIIEIALTVLVVVSLWVGPLVANAVGMICG